MKISIITDSTCDLPPKTVQQWGITVLPLNIHLGDQAYKDGVDLSREEFYRQLPGLNPFPKTASPGPAGFQRLYQQLADLGAEAILSIHISEKLSATVNEARIAAQQFSRIPVTVLDSGQLSLGMGFLVEKAAELAAVGASMEEILASLTEMMKRTYVFASLNTLKYLRRSGRMNAALASFGELLQIKPLLHMHQGNPAAHRVRTQGRATERMMSWLEEVAPFEKLAIVHAGAQKEAEEMLKRIEHFLPQAEIPIAQITPALGAHLGVGAIGFAGVSRKDES